MVVRDRGGDFDGDGHLDLAVGNVGRNTGYALFRPSPIRIYFGDWTGAGPLGALESFGNGQNWFPINNRAVLSELLPDIDPSVAGISIWGKQRSAALADIKHDGRIDIAVTQVDGPIRLFINRLARPGLRVELTGTAKNPECIGAVIPLGYPGGVKGPARAIPAGSGYGAQDSSRHVLGFTQPPNTLQVTWPGGGSQVVALEPGSLRIQIKQPARE